MSTVLADNTCAQSGCHAPVDAANAPMVPAGQLDLTDGPSTDEPDQFNSYRELLFADDRQILLNGALVDEQVQIGVDAMGNPILSTVSIPCVDELRRGRANRGSSRASTSAAPGARRSPHAGYLSLDELRLIAEWLDIGAQYYNNPFDVPVM